VRVHSVPNTQESGFTLIELLVVVAGCAPKFNTTPPPKVYPVNGKVLLASGMPVSAGLITFHPKTRLGAEASGEIAPDGSFQLTTIVKNDGALPGSYTVSVDPYFKGGRPSKVPASRVPPKFCAPETSDLTAEIKAEDNNLTIELK
jgi:hypothetical protein